jgi:FdhE protein
MKHSKWNRRIERADELARAHPFAAGVLKFYKQLTIVQMSIYSSLESHQGNGLSTHSSCPWDENRNFETLTPHFPQFLSQIAAMSPEPITQAARTLSTLNSSAHGDLLSAHWRNESQTGGSPESMLVLTFLQPYAEFLADHTKHSPHNEEESICPLCRHKPVVGILRPEGDGGKRSLVCSLCVTEWKYGRIRCVGCGEEAVDKLAVYTAEQFPHIRVEACDTCRCYIKTVDLTRNGLAVPIVDELATLPLNLWAQEHQYLKLQSNFLGI